MRWTTRIRHRGSSRSGTALLDAGPQPTASAAESFAPPVSAPLDQTDENTQEVAGTPHASDGPVGCRVVVLGPTGSLRALTTALPPSWSLEHADEVGDLTVADLVVVVSPTPGKVAAILARQPDASVVALTHPAARVDVVVELLQSGATACVRSSEVDLVAAHLIACARRYSVGAR